MAKRDSKTARARGNILSRDATTGEEHGLTVMAVPGGLISVSDDTFERLLSPAAAVELTMSLISALGSFVPLRPGPITGSF